MRYRQHLQETSDTHRSGAGGRELHERSNLDVNDTSRDVCPSPLL